MVVTLNKSKLKNTFLFYYSLFIVGLLLGTVNFTSPIILYILFGCCLSLFAQPVYIIPVYFVSSLANTYFIAGDGLGIGRFIGGILICSGLFHLSKNSNLENKTNIRYIILITIFICFSSMLSETGSLQAFFMFLQYFAVVVILSQFRNINLVEISKLLVLSSILTILVLGFTLQENLYEIGNERLSSNDDVNANRFAMMLSQLGAVTFAGFLIFNKKKIFQSFLIIFLLFDIFMVLLSGSRSALIGITGAISIIIFYLLLGRKKMVVPVLIAIIPVYFFVKQIQSINSPIIERFSTQEIEDSGGSGRLTIWEKLVPSVLRDDLYFGCGFGAENVLVLANKNGLYYPAHNFFIDLFLQIGIVGFAIFISYFLFVAKNIKNYIESPLILIPLLILLTALFNGIGETIFSEKLFWNGIAFTWLYINNLKLESTAMT